MGLTFTTAFIAGMLSFISPCILPLAPGYVAMISGVSVEELRERQHGILWRVLLNAFLFVLGFSILFVGLGASAGVAGRFLSAHRELLNRIAGAVIVFFGALLLGLIRFPRFIATNAFMAPLQQASCARSCWDWHLLLDGRHVQGRRWWLCSCSLRPSIPLPAAWHCSVFIRRVWQCHSCWWRLEPASLCLFTSAGAAGWSGWNVSRVCC